MTTDLNKLVAEIRDEANSAAAGYTLKPSVLHHLLMRAADALEQQPAPDLFVDAEGGGDVYHDLAKNYFRWRRDQLGIPVPFLTSRNCGMQWVVAKAVRFDELKKDWVLSVEMFPTEAEALLATAPEADAA